MVWNPGTFSERRLCRADVESTIELRGIACDNFSAKFFRERDSQGGLAGCRGAHNHDEWQYRYSGIHRNRICHPRKRRMPSTTIANRMLPSTCWRESFKADSESPAADCKDRSPAIRYTGR